MKTRILPPAIEDIASGRIFYSRQGEGLGDYFMNSIFTEIDSLSLYAGIHSTRLGYHRLIAKRFPYGIYYRLEGDVVLIYRILDCRRDPAWVQQQLKEKPEIA